MNTRYESSSEGGNSVKQGRWGWVARAAMGTGRAASVSGEIRHLDRKQPCSWLAYHLVHHPWWLKQSRSSDSARYIHDVISLIICHKWRPWAVAIHKQCTLSNLLFQRFTRGIEVWLCQLPLYFRISIRRFLEVSPTPLLSR